MMMTRNHENKGLQPLQHSTLIFTTQNNEDETGPFNETLLNQDSLQNYPL